MYSLLDRGSRRRASEARFRAAYQAAADTATLVSVSLVRVGGRRHDVVPVRMRASTRLFGTLVETLDVPLTGSGSSARVRFSTPLTFPGLQAGERLTRRSALPPRATLLAGDGTPLASGPSRSSPIPSVAAGIVGSLGPIPHDARARYSALGYPPGAMVGRDGLEAIFERRLAGTPAATLLAGSRVLAARSAVPGQSVRTTIVPSIEQAVLTAIAGRYAGMIAMDPRTGAIEGAAGVAWSAVQPPGSTMKIITSTAALDAGIVTLSSSFPIATEADVGGYILRNAGGEACGGTLLNAFAVSCNSVFAPLGVKVGAVRLVATAERFGFDQPPPFADAVESTIPSAAAIGSATDVGSSAIGQGRVQATALEMTEAAAAIAMGGRRPQPTLLAAQPPAFSFVTSARVAGLVERMMVAVVRYGTGTAAQIPGVVVAGKTGTAELRSENSPGANSPQNTDSWFVGYGPVGAPRIVVGALFPAQGAGAETAAPAVHDVLAAALHRG
jgi:cell division protein FtsI/penicillin-binding protein 2